jgi:hypothetical protein
MNHTIDKQGTDFEKAYKIFKPEEIVRILEKETGNGRVIDFEWLKRGEEYYEVFVIKTEQGEIKKVYFNVTDLLNLY